MFEKVLIANRGAIACRIIRTLRRMGVGAIAVYSEADRHARHVREADAALCIGAPPAAESYLRQDRIIQAALDSGAQAIHPGYGFLSENAAFAEACEAAGIAFIGPTPRQMRDFGLKHTARELTLANGLPLLPGSGLLDDLAQARGEAARIGYPVMLKSTAGGGGIGMQLCRDAAQLEQAFDAVSRLARGNFSQGGIFLERFVERARHIEVQLFGDGAGAVIALGERDCSVQRRNQKVIEETPAPLLDDATRAALLDAAVRLGRSVRYRSAGTVEFVLDADSGAFYFLEVNTRLQVEHGVTEEVTGVDLVEWMVRLAAGDDLRLETRVPTPRGCSIQVRLYAEDPGRNFQPSSGLLTEVALPQDLRCDAWIETGCEVPPHYDPMLAKLIVHGDDRADALAKLERALAATRLHGIETNLDYLRAVVNGEIFRAGRQTTRSLLDFEYRPASIEVLAPGTQTTVQDWPGRTGHWDVGVPPSGPMDELAFRLANRLLGNDAGAPALEMTVTGPTLRFNVPTAIALTGAHMKATLNVDGATRELPYWQALSIPAGATLKLRGIDGAGARACLAVRGGLDVPRYMGSAATFTLGHFGGHGGRALRVGDVLHLHATDAVITDAALPAASIPVYGHHWDIAVMYGPHGAPDFFTDDDVAMLFATDWEVHYNSSRTGVRLIGPKPQWARSDGGEAGLHPSNIHDNAYAIGAVDFTGDMPVILGPDGPSLGGFVCPVTVIAAERWKLGQLRPGDRLRFHAVTVDEAERHARALDAAIDAPGALPSAPAVIAHERVSPILATLPDHGARPTVCYRQAGDRHLLIEYGPMALDLDLRFRVHALMQWLSTPRPGMHELTPGIRSLQVHYDPRLLPQSRLLDLLIAAEDALPPVDAMKVPSRIVHLPLSWDDPATRQAIERYMQSVRADAPWCPSNIEFIRRINGLDSIDDVRRIVFDASYLVMGLGDVYLGAPVATPLDPRHRLVTTKYNPARTWTPENAVGIGGAYLCVYGMEGPGGYQFVGRTLQMWNPWRQTDAFNDGKQWLLRFFDQIRFFPVSAEELLRIREDFPLGRYRLRIEESELDLAAYQRFLADNRASIAEFKTCQQAAFEAERERWRAAGQTAHVDEAVDVGAADAMTELPPGCLAVASPVTGSVWQIAVTLGQRVEVGQPLLVVEAMKMEVSIEADEAGVVADILCAPGDGVHAGQALLVLRLATE